MGPKRVLVALAVFTAFLGCRFGGDTTVPDDLVGVWKTSAPKYANRSLGFTKDSIIFGTGKGRLDARRIVKVRRVQEGRRFLYTISYTIEQGQVYRLSFYYDRANGGMIRLKNQKRIVWMKERH